MQIRCPHCLEAFDAPSEGFVEILDCPACSGRFQLQFEDTVSTSAAGMPAIAHFQPIERLGAGGFGSVWKARDTKLDRMVALKISRKENMTPQESDSFLREARSAARLKHPNIVAVHEVGRHENSLYIVSDYVQGATLADVMRSQRFRPRDAVELCAKIADALHHAHESGVIHRDLKPGNIMMGPAGEPFLVDFGLARRECEVTVTVAGQILGTAAYMSPEQACGEGHSADRRSDVYSLGIVLFELLTGERPFRGNSQAILYQRLNSDPPGPRILNHALSRDLDAICLKALSREPARRYASADALACDLRRYLHGESVEARPGTQASRLWRWCQRSERIHDTGRITMFVGLLLSAWAMAGYPVAYFEMLEGEMQFQEAALSLLFFQSIYIVIIAIGAATCRYVLPAIWLGTALSAALTAYCLLLALGRLTLRMGGLQANEGALSPLYMLLTILSIIMLVAFGVALIAYYSNPKVVSWTRHRNTLPRSGATTHPYNPPAAD